MTRKRLLLLIAALASCALVVAGCGGGDDGSDEPEAGLDSGTDGAGAGSAGGSAPADQPPPGDATEPSDLGLTLPEDVSEEELQQVLENAPEQIEEAIRLCKEGVENSELSGKQREAALDLCDANAESARKALESLGE